MLSSKLTQSVIREMVDRLICDTQDRRDTLGLLKKICRDVCVKRRGDAASLQGYWVG